jgi:hypothetical protein
LPDKKIEFMDGLVCQWVKSLKCELEQNRWFYHRECLVAQQNQSHEFRGKIFFFVQKSCVEQKWLRFVPTKELSRTHKQNTKFCKANSYKDGVNKVSV